MSARVIDIRRYQRDWRARDPQPLEPLRLEPRASVVRNAALLLAALGGAVMLWALEWWR